MAREQVLLRIFPDEGVSQFLKSKGKEEKSGSKARGGLVVSQDCDRFVITVYSVLAASLLESGRGPCS